MTGYENQNLLRETIKTLSEYGYELADIIWIRCEGKNVPIEQFKEIAARTEYEAGYGGHEVSGSLKIRVGRHLFVRGVYDGAEWWEPIDISDPTEEWQGQTFLDGSMSEKDDDRCIGGE